MNLKIMVKKKKKFSYKVQLEINKNRRNKITYISMEFSERMEHIKPMKVNHTSATCIKSSEDIS